MDKNLLLIAAVGVGAFVLLNKNKEEATTTPGYTYQPKQPTPATPVYYPNPTAPTPGQIAIETGKSIIEIGKSLLDLFKKTPTTTPPKAPSTAPKLTVAYDFDSSFNLSR